MKKYLQIYDYYKDKIITNQIHFGEKMPSIRSATNLFSVSKTTILNAYFALQADGYIIAIEKSGFFVSYKIKEKTIEYPIIQPTKNIKYDLVSGDADKESFNIKLWQRYIKSALRQGDKMLSYSEEKGELELREALCDYIKKKRNVITSPDKIIIGAGVQCLFTVLCSLLKDKKTVSFPNSSFDKGIALFEDYGYEVTTRNKNAQIIYVPPSHMTRYGNVMSIKRRLELVEYSQKNNSLVIEDDYDNDFVYQSKPTPSLYALSSADNVVYIGSFSNVLIPGIRISFMVLTNELTEKFNNNIYKFSQTASKTEQIALSQYIRDGHINAQIKKVSRHYTNKTKTFCNLIKESIPNCNCEISDNRLQVKIQCKFNKNIDEFEKNNLAVYVEEYKNNNLKIILSPSAIESNQLNHVVNLLKGIICN